MLKVRLNLRTVVAIAICLAGVTMFLGCDKKDDPDVEDNRNGNGNTTIADPVGTITANIAIGAEIQLQIDKSVCVVSWTKPDNVWIRGNYYYYDNHYPYGIYHYFISICSVGKINGLGAITKIQTSGYTNPTTDSNGTLSCDAGYGYIIKIEKKDSYDGVMQQTQQTTYARMYVVESIVSTGGGVMGAKVKYQYPFEP